MPTEATLFKQRAQATHNLDPTEATLQAWLQRGRSEVFSVVADLTPDLAAKLLARNPANRPIRERGQTRSVEAYAAAMRRGEWVLNGQTLSISKDGLLNDGQHRCSAVIEAGVPVAALLTFGVDRDSRHTVDQGAARTPGQILAMRGEKNYNQLASAAHFLWCYRSGLPFSYRPSNDQMIDVVEGNPGLGEAVTDAALLAKSFRISGGYLAGAYFLCRELNRGVADDLLRKTQTGIGILNEREPVNKLRKRYTDHLSKTNLIQGPEVAALFIKAFNATIRGRTLQALMWRQEGPAAEDFPIVGS